MKLIDIGANVDDMYFQKNQKLGKLSSYHQSV